MNIALFAVLVAIVACNCGVHAQDDLTSRVAWNAFETVLDTAVPLLIHQRPNDENGTLSQNEKLALSDNSNDVIAQATAQQILSRSGYNYVNHYVVADDGYITQLVRIINPLADPRKLKQPPVMLMHGGIIDMTAYLWASAIQHFPEPWPSTSFDGSKRSSNRSLAMMLANRGFDVWLVGTRGSDEQNKGHIKIPRQNARQGKRATGLKIDDAKPEYVQILEDLLGPLLEPQNSDKKNDIDYYNYTMNEIIDYEIPRQIDKVLEVTGAKQVSLLALSISTPLVFPLLASNTTYASKVLNHISMMPIINSRGGNLATQFVFRSLCLDLPPKLGTLLFTDLLTSRPLRKFLVNAFRDTQKRYALYKILVSILTGASAKYNTWLEMPIVGHIFMPIGFKHVQHFCQVLKAERYQKFDYGKEGNIRAYGQAEPPVYDISDLHIENFMIAQGTNDNLAPQASVQQIVDQVKRPKLRKRVIVPRYSHLDMLAAFDNDLRVNKPIAQFLEKFQSSAQHLRSNPRLLPMNSNASDVSNEVDFAQFKSKARKSVAEETYLESYVPSGHDGLSGAAILDGIHKRSVEYKRKMQHLYDKGIYYE